jgi:hypothetical protein
MSMRFAEVFLRLGASLVAWMMLFSHLLWLAALYVMNCGPDGDEMYRLLLGLAPFTCGFAVLLRVTRPFAEIHSMLRWLSLPLLLLLPFALRSVWQVIRSVNLNSVAICADMEPTTWQLMWAPIQVLTLICISYMLIRVWLDSSGSAKSDDQEIEQSN